MQKNLRQIRVHGLPKPPVSCQEIVAAFSRDDIRDKFGFSHHKEKRKLFYNGSYENRSFSYCVFSSANSIKLIHEVVQPDSRTILMDATFAIVPLGCFKQILIIYGAYSGKVSDMILLLYE